jgi:hypothetical protein
MLPPIPPLAVGAGQLLGPAFACGLNLYATVALLGIAARLGWADALPLGLRGLEHPLVIASAIALYAVEFVVDKIRFLDTAWDALHTLIRPAAAALLAVLALQGSPVGWQIAAAGAAGAAALSAHGLKAGMRLRLNERRRPLGTVTVSVAEDLLAAAMALAALTLPAAAAGMALAMLLLIVLLGPRLIRPAVTGMHVVEARLRGFFGSRRWRTRDEMPRPLRPHVAPPGLGSAPARVARAALLRAGNGAGHYRNGWLVVGDGAPRFLYRHLLGTRRIELPLGSAARLRPGLLADALELEAEAGAEDVTLLLLKDGPDPRLALAELTRNDQP